MNRADGSDRPEDVDATFAEIVSDLRAEGVGEIEPDESGQSARDESDRDNSTTHRESSPNWRDSESHWEEVLFGDDPAGTDEDEHYVPPEPPPLPKPRRGAFLVLLFFVLGLVLLIAPSLIGLSDAIGMPLGMLSLATGIGLLLLRVRQGPPEGSDPDNGAQV